VRVPVVTVVVTAAVMVVVAATVVVVVAAAIVVVVVIATITVKVITSSLHRGHGQTMGGAAASLLLSLEPQTQRVW
jgi:hypothetical protein